jgi:hypothetical protein
MNVVLRQPHQAIQEVPQPPPERQAAPRLARCVSNSSSLVITSANTRRLPQFIYV